MNRILGGAIFAAALFVGAQVAQASPTACPALFVGGQSPDLLLAKLTAKARALCFEDFALVHSGLTRGPLWSAEHMIGATLRPTLGSERNDSFHAEDAIPADERSELSDYSRSGYDRGHMSCFEDRLTETSRGQSFSLSNMIPQDPNNNRGLWARIERAVRDIALDHGEVYSVTGPIFDGAFAPGGQVTYVKGQNRVVVPTRLFKAVFDPSTGTSAVYLTPNAPGNDYTVISVTELQTLTGIDVFPALPKSVKDVAGRLPEPGRSGRHTGQGYGYGSPAAQPTMGSYRGLGGLVGIATAMYLHHQPR